MSKQGIGSVRGRSERGNLSLHDMIVDGEGEPKEEEQEKPPQRREAVEATRAKHDTQLPAGKGPKSGKKRRNDRRRINYFAALDDIIADIYEKQGAGFRIVQAVTQLFESRGGAPFEEAHFERTCRSLSMIQATREIAWLFGLGPEHADQVTSLMIDKLFGPPREKK